MIILLLLHQAVAYKISPLTKSPGITAVKLQDAYIVKEHYTYMHNINISTLQDELDNIRYILKLMPKNNIQQLKVMELYLNNTQDKLDHIFINSRHRLRRGLINGLGTVISWITGNMDADDKEKYDNILRNMQTNEYHLEHNVENQLSVNQKLINEFDKDLRIIQKNNFKLPKYLEELNGNSNSLKLEQRYLSLFTSLSMLYNKITYRRKRINV